MPETQQIQEQEFVDIPVEDDKAGEETIGIFQFILTHVWLLLTFSPGSVEANWKGSEGGGYKCLIM